ncbi:exonuclease domain-containing protein [Spirillospora sp. NPDC048911]|uniref:exonuclease domain-containing protein n=1 Tax=Spirillospora sp. NPDC048911 TaxID=3364527 RepID=UPI0037213FD1
MSANGYAVVDVETTGLRPAWRDRVIEIGIVLLDGAGEITGEWGSLVNPGRDLGPRHIHRITAADVRHAPPFAELAGTVAGLLRGRILAAHNLRFDQLFLFGEFEQAGIPAPLDDPDAGVCTMTWAPHFLPDAPRNLAGCCALAEVPLSGHHDALVDARAAAGLLRHYLRLADGAPPWSAEVAERKPWPVLPVARAAPVRRGASAERDTHFLARILDTMPRVAEPAGADDYLALLDQVLLDHDISPSAADALVAFANGIGLSWTDLRRLHLDYLAALARSARAAGTPVRHDEHGELVRAARLLDLPPETVDEALAHAGPVRPIERFRLEPGDLVAFTGEAEDPRETFERRARAAGLTPHPRVTRDVRLLVAADRDSLSQKARRARIYGIPIVTTATFRRLLAT